MWKILARHKDWVAGCTITESVDTSTDSEDFTERRFSATIDGFTHWRIGEYETCDFEELGGAGVVGEVVEKVRKIQERIRAGDDAVFGITGAW